MNVGLEFKIDSLNNIIIQDTTKYNTEDESGKSLHSFKASETGSVFVLEYHKDDKESIYLSPMIINNHSQYAEYTIKIPRDGWFTIHHIVLPTREYLESFTRIELKGVRFAYCIDFNQIRDLNNLDDNGNPKKVTIKEVLEGNTNIATTSMIGKDYISILHLQKCLVNLCLEIFKQITKAKGCFSNKFSNSDLVFKRDLVWMAINVIKYMSKYNMKAEAARIITQLEGCNGICTGTSSSEKISECGCYR